MSIISGETLIAVTGALGGGVLVKVVDRWYQLREKREDISESFRKDMRVDIDSLRRERDDARKETEEWRAKYYTLFEAHSLLEASQKVIQEELARARDPHIQA